jgi:heat shock protein HslJ
MKYAGIVLCVLVLIFGCQKKNADEAAHDHADADHSHADHSHTDSSHAAHSHGGAPVDTLARGPWHWIATVTPVGRIAPPNPENYTIEILPDTTLAARLDCNRGSGRCVIDGKSIRIGPLATTRMACPPGTMDSVFGKSLDAVRVWFMYADTLMLDLYADSGTMRFVR